MNQELLSKLPHFSRFLSETEKSPATISKYLHDVKHFLDFTSDSDIYVEQVLAYKNSLIASFAPSSVNSMLASLNSFFRFIDRKDLCVRQLKLQRSLYCSEEKELTREEYKRLVYTAERVGNHRLSLALQTICSTGIRVSELKFITVESLISGFSTINSKGKIRKILIPKDLKNPLLSYAKKNSIKTGSIFITKYGNPLNRSNIWKEMKSICLLANVSPKKVFPHNLRHLFARLFYSIKKDIAILSDILGHSNINTTRIYTKSSGMEHRRLLNSLNLILWE